MGNIAALVEQIKAQTPTPPKPEAPASTPSAIASSTDSRTPEQKAADSAKYLKADVPSIGKPTWNYWDGAGRYANIIGADGKEYMFVPDDYVKKGLVQDGVQFYNKQFLDPATFKNAVQYSLPKGMQSVVNNNGYVWSVDDYNKLGLNSSNGYKIDADNPAIIGLGNPHPSMQVGAPIAYITQPKLAPGGERVQQDWITAADGRQGGLGQYAYYRYQGPFADLARGALQSLGPLTPILLDVFAGPGTGAIYSMSKAAGEGAITGDWNKAATTIGTILAAPYVSGAVAGAVGSALDMGTLANSIVGNAVGNAAVAGLTGGDPVAAMINSGVGGAVGAITGKIDGFGDLPPSVQKVFNATVRAELSGKDPSKAAILAATTAGLQAIKNGMDINDRIQKNYGREATPEELNNFAYVSTPEELNNSFDKYMTNTAAASQAEADRIARETAAANESARQAAIDEQNRLDAAEAERRANDEAERLRLAGLQEKTNVDLNKVVTGDDTKIDAEAAARQAIIDEQNRLDEAERLRLAGLEENKNVDLNKVVTGTDAGVSKDFISSGAGGGAEGLGTEGSAEDANQAKRVAEFGKDLTGGGAQDLGVQNADTGFYDPNASSTGAYKYDPTSGTYTYTSDDGSTLTLDADGNIVGSTEATDTSWAGLTDTATGNLKLPKLPGGITPAVKAPVKKVTTTTTGAGNTAITSGSSTVVQTSGNTAVQTGGGLNVPALLAIMSQFGQQPQQQVQQTQEPGQDFEYFDWAADPFAPKTKEKTNPTGQPKMAHGGSIDELLEILRRSGI